MQTLGYTVSVEVTFRYHVNIVSSSEEEACAEVGRMAFDEINAIGLRDDEPAITVVDVEATDA